MPKRNHIRISDLIRDRLRQGSTTSYEIWRYVVRNGGIFRVTDNRKQRKSISGQLSKMKSRCEAILHGTTWGLKNR